VRVLIVIDDLRRAGAQRVIVQEIQALHPDRVDFHVVALAHITEPNFTRELSQLGVGLDYLPGWGLLDPRRVLALRRLISRLEPDLVHTHLSYANILGALAATLAGRPVIVSLHNVDINQLRWPSAKRSLEGFIIGHWAACIVVVCASLRVPTTRNFDVPLYRTVVVPNGIDPATIRLSGDFDRTRKREELGVSPGEKLMCTVARLEPSKGHRFLIHALAVLQARHIDDQIRLAIIGGGSEEDSIRQLIRSLSLSDRVVLLGIREDVSEIIAASDLFVLPSLNEGLSQALLEAMALSTPVIATNVGGTPDIVAPGHTGWRVVPGQPVALADAIQQALGRPDTAAAYARAAHTLATQGFSLQSHLSRLQSVYDDVAWTAQH
jgi:glycosyltransferase involved in cell wall biosynthesis